MVSRSPLPAHVRIACVQVLIRVCYAGEGGRAHRENPPFRGWKRLNGATTPGQAADGIQPGFAPQMPNRASVFPKPNLVKSPYRRRRRRTG